MTMSRVRRLCVVGVMGYVLLASVAAQAQVTYSWSANTSGSWSTGAWSPGGNPGASDTANLENLGTTSTPPTIQYDVGASGTVGTLNFFNNVITGSAPTTTLVLGQDLHIATAASMYMISGGAGAVTINTNGHSLYVDSGATFTYGAAISNLSTFANFTGTGTGGLVVNGTFTALSDSTATWSPSAFTAATTFNNGSVLNIDSEASGGTRMAFGGNFTTTGNVSINATGASKLASSIYFTGANINIGSGTTFTGFGAQAATGGPLVFDSTSANPNQAITLGVVAPFGVRNTYAGTQATPVTAVDTVTATGTSGPISNAVGAIFWTNSSNYSTSTLKLGSNLNVTQSSALSISANTAGIGANLALDLNGFALDLSQSGAASRFGFTTNLANADIATIKNSGASSVASGQGVFKALGFNFVGSSIAPGDTAIGAGVILQATGGVTNDLGVFDAAALVGTAANGTVPAVAPVLIDPTSVFYFASSGSTSLQSTNARAIGQLMAGDVAGSAAGTSTISLLSNIVAQGVTTVNSGGILDIDGNSYTTTGLTGSGQVKNNAAVATVATLNIVATGTNTFSGAIYNGATAGQNNKALSVTIASGSTGTQIFSGSNGYVGTTTVNGGTLLMTGTYNGGGAVTVNSGGRFGGAGGSVGANVTVNAGGGLSVSGRGTVAAGTMAISGTGSVLDLSAALNQSSELSFVLGSNAGTSDMVFVSSFTGLLKIGTGLLSLGDFDFATGSTFGAGTYVLFDTKSATGITGSLAASGLTGTLNGYNVILSEGLDGSGFQDIVLTAAAVPEPSVALLLLAGGLGLAALRRRPAALRLS